VLHYQSSVFFNFLKVLLVPVQNELETVIFLFLFRKKFSAGVPTQGILVFAVNPSVELGWSIVFGHRLLAEFVWSVAKHNTFVVSDGCAGHGIADNL